MTVIVGVIGAALLFGLYTLLRPGDTEKGCTGRCAGCKGDGACRAEGAGR